MKVTKVRMPSEEEFEAIVLAMELQITAIREEAGDKTYTVEVGLGRLEVEVPTRSWWRVVEEAE